MQCSKALYQLIFSLKNLLQNIRHMEAAILLVIYGCFGKHLKLNLFQITHTFWCLSVKLLPLHIFIFVLKLNIKEIGKFLSASKFAQSHLNQRHFLRIFREFQMQGNFFFTSLYYV